MICSPKGDPKNLVDVIDEWKSPISAWSVRPILRQFHFRTEVDRARLPRVQLFSSSIHLPQDKENTEREEGTFQAEDKNSGTELYYKGIPRLVEC